MSRARDFADLAGGNLEVAGEGILRLHEVQLDTSVTIPANTNGLCAGPITLATGVVITVATGATLVVA